MSLQRFQPPGRRRRFDIVAYDRHDKPLLIVEIKRANETRQHERFLEDITNYVEASSRPAPFFIIADEVSIALYHKTNETRKWERAYDFDSKSVLHHYDEDYGKNPIYEHYLTSLIQVWLNDIADHWHSETPPGFDIFQQLGLIDALNKGSLAVDATL